MTELNISESACHVLARICRLNRGLMHNLMSKIGLHQGQPYVLELLWQEDGRTHSELAAQLHVSAATVSNTIRRMEKAGFVERRPDPHDERVSRVYLTAAGWDIQQTVKRLLQTFEMWALDGFSEAEVVVLQDFCGRLHDNLLGISGEDLLACVNAPQQSE